MTDLLAIEEVRALVKTSVSDVDLVDVVRRVEAELVDELGDWQDDTGNVQVTEEHQGGGERIYLAQPADSIVSATEDSVAVASTGYRLEPGGMVRRLPEGAKWSGWVEVTYKPRDRRSEWKSALIELVRIDLERTSMDSESVGGEYSYSASDWEKKRQSAKRRLRYRAI